MVFFISILETFIQIIITQIIRQTHGCNFFNNLGQKLQVRYSSKVRKNFKVYDGFFSRGDNTAFFMVFGIEVELNERFTTLLIIASESSIQ